MLLAAVLKSIGYKLFQSKHFVEFKILANKKAR